jgi:hypothetical protein
MADFPGEVNSTSRETVCSRTEAAWGKSGVTGALVPNRKNSIHQD